MFEALPKKLNGIFYKLGTKGRLTEKDIDASLREVRMALLEADVNFRVARQLVSAIKERALAEDLLTRLTPGQQVVKITQEELTKVLTGGQPQARERFPTARRGSDSRTERSGQNHTGRQSSRTTSNRGGQSSMLVAADLHRPAAIDQLETLASQIDVHVYADRRRATPTRSQKTESPKRAKAA